MSPFLQLILVLSIIIVAAKAAGYLTIRLGQPSVFGELLVGLLLGPSLLDLTHLPVLTDTHLGEVIHELGEMGVLLLMFLAGLELDLRELAHSSRVAVFGGTLGVLVPVGMGYTIGAWLGLSTPEAVFLGLSLGATSVSVSAQTLMELGILRTRVGISLLGAAVFDDIIVILLLSLFTALQIGQSGPAVIAITILRMLAFLAGSVALGLFLLPVISRRIEGLGISQGIVASGFVVMLVFAFSAEIVGGMAAITGAFVAGLMYARTPQKRQIEHGFSILGFSLFIPIFFVDIGLRVDLGEIRLSAIWILLLILTAAVLGKVLGAGTGARAGGLTWRDALKVGIGMISRGEVGLIVASVGLAEGLLDTTLFAIVVGMILTTTLITPPLLRLVTRPVQSPLKEAG
jgi:Kef-type K+ transport system membrane component KefB